MCSSSFIKKVSSSIIYVDDNPIDSWLAERILAVSEIAYKVITASNGIKGLEVIKEYYEDYEMLPDLIIVDLQMPIMNGFEMIQRIKQLPYYSEVKTTLILITAGLDEEDIQRISEIGIKNVLLKPLEKEELRRLLN